MSFGEQHNQTLEVDVGRNRDIPAHIVVSPHDQIGSFEGRQEVTCATSLKGPLKALTDNGLSLYDTTSLSAVGKPLTINPHITLQVYIGTIPPLRPFDLFLRMSYSSYLLQASAAQLIGRSVPSPMAVAGATSIDNASASPLQYANSPRPGTNIMNAPSPQQQQRQKLTQTPQHPQQFQPQQQQLKPQSTPGMAQKGINVWNTRIMNILADAEFGKEPTKRAKTTRNKDSNCKCTECMCSSFAKCNVAPAAAVTAVFPCSSDAEYLFIITNKEFSTDATESTNDEGTVATFSGTGLIAFKSATGTNNAADYICGNLAECIFAPLAVTVATDFSYLLRQKLSSLSQYQQHLRAPFMPTAALQQQQNLSSQVPLQQRQNLPQNMHLNQLRSQTIAGMTQEMKTFIIGSNIKLGQIMCGLSSDALTCAK
eukprot:Gb_37269 [translate_table: standard]